jgi:NAD(P)-dependent dehydrogenase (short-subunit alcohol dehydrogenase family)
MGKTIFITGASAGLGKACAFLFAQNGWKVFATMRKPEDGKDLSANANITVLALDVTDLAQIESVVAEVLKSGKVDVVLNNAGYGLAGPFESATDEQIQRQLDTNLLGTMRVTKAFIPHFREKKGGIFIAVTSIGGLVTFPFNSAYHSTKWALEGWSESLSYELGEMGITVKTVAPGGIKTDFAGRSLVLTEHVAYKSLAEKVLKVFMDPKRQAQGSSAEQIAAVVYTAATDGKSQLRYLAGKDAKMMYRMRKLLGYKFFMKQIRKAFFK